MKKSLIAVAVASAFIAPAAMAEVTLSGAINLGIQVGKTNGGTAGQSLTRTQLGSNYSHMDLESVDDIGGGNKVIFHYQMDISGSSSAQIGQAGGAIGNRNSFLGIAGGWGAFKMGTNENVYERMMYTADPLDGAAGVGGNLTLLGTPGAGAVFQVGQGNCGPSSSVVSVGGVPTVVTSAGNCVDFYRRSDQTIWYESPNFSGFSFEIDRTLSAFKTAGANSIDPTITSIGGKFQPEGAPFYVDLSYELHKDMFGLTAIAAANGTAIAGTSSKDTGIQIGAGYTIGDLGLHVRFEQLKYKEDGVVGPVDEYKRNAEWIGVKYNLPSGYVGGEVGVAQSGKTNQGTVSDTGAKLYGLGYFHNLSKQSQLQFIYGLIKNDKKATYEQAGAPEGALGVAGGTQQTFTVAIKHTF
jgi:predicted porin